ncbi:hypothetical protein BC833DRAFT_603509 [Globomyces pollinis-pini]|nr:hypothetical protein BC833DRAFT_603509 [Globomyces pollinis-pini]
MEQNDGDWFHQFDNFNIDTNIALDDIITNKNNKTSYNLNYEDVLGISRDVNTVTSNSFSPSESNGESNNLMFSEVKSSANNNTEPHFEPDPEFSIRHRTDSMKVQVHRDFPKYKSYLSFSTAADQITTSKPVYGMNSCAHNLNLYIGLRHTTLVCTHCHKNYLLFNLHNLTNQIFDLLRYNCDGSQYQTSIPDMIPFKVRQKASYLYDYQCELCGMVTDYKALSKHYHFHMRQFMRDGIRRILEPSTDYKKVDSHGDSDRIATASFGKQDDGILGISDTVPLMRLSTYDASSPPKLRPDRLLSARMEYLDQQDNGNVEISDTTPLNRLSTYEANSPPRLQPARLLSAHMEYIEHNDGLYTQVEGSLGLGLGAPPKHSINMGGQAFSTHQMLPMAGNPSQNLPRSNTIELINQSLFGHDLNQGNMPLLDSTQDHIPSATVAKQSPKIKRLNTIERVNQSLFGSTIPESILESEASDVPKHTTRNDEYPPRFKPLKKNLYSLDPNHNAPMVFNTNEMGWSANHSQHPIPPRPLPTPPSQYRELLQETPTLNTLEKIQQKVYNRHKSSGSSELSDQWNFEGFQLNKHTDWESVNGSNSIVSSISSLEKIYEYAGMENPSQTSIPPRPSRMSNSMLPFDGSIPDTQNAIHEKGMKHISDSVNTHSSWLNVPPFNRVDDSQFNSLPQPKTQVNDQISTLNRIASGLKKSKSSGMLNVPESQPITHNIDQETLPTLSRRSVSPNAATYLHQNRSSNISPSPQIGGIQFVPDTRDFAEGMYIKSPNSNSKLDQPTFGQTRSVSPSYIQFGMPKANRRGSKYAESLLEDSLGKTLSPNQTNQQSLPHNPTLNPTVNRNDDITIEMLQKELNSTEQIDSDILLNRYRNLILQLGKQLQERQ